MRRRQPRRAPPRACGQLHSELVANDHDQLHDPEQEHEQQWQAQSQLDRSLAAVPAGGVVASAAAVRVCR